MPTAATEDTAARHAEGWTHPGEEGQRAWVIRVRRKTGVDRILKLNLER